MKDARSLFKVYKLLNEIFKSFKRKYNSSHYNLGNIFFDRFSKIKILQILENSDIIFINDYLNLDLIFNTGIGFGLLSMEANIFYDLISVFIALVIIFLIYYAIKSKNIEKYFFSLVIGGAIGNLFDRVYYKAVPDFIDLHFKDFHWFSFNIADIFISLGIVLLILNELKFKKKNNEI